MTHPLTETRAEVTPQSRIRALLEAAIASRAFPGGVVGVSWGGEELIEAAGRFTYAPGACEVTTETLFDLASLTKVVATTSLVMTLVQAGRLSLDLPVGDVVAGFGGGGREAITVRHLLNHSSGLPAHEPFFRECERRDDIKRRISSMALEREPGRASVYSDVGFILLGAFLENLLQEDLASGVDRAVLGRLAMRETRFCPPREWYSRIAPTEVCPWRGRLLQGEVHDENAFALGGVAGHAGLFGGAADLLRFGRTLLGGGSGGEAQPFLGATVDLFTKRCDVPGSTRALGWDTADVQAAPRSSTPGGPGYSSAGMLLSRRSFGHTGFTGTSLWIDPERRLVLVLLTNRVHPDRSNDAIRGVRSALADVVAAMADERAGAAAARHPSIRS